MEKNLRNFAIPFRLALSFVRTLCLRSIEPWPGEPVVGRFRTSLLVRHRRRCIPLHFAIRSFQ